MMTEFLRDSLVALEPVERIAVLERLPPREEKVIRMLYGIAENGELVQRRRRAAIAMHFAVSHERLAQVIHKGERRLAMHLRRRADDLVLSAETIE